MTKCNGKSSDFMLLDNDGSENLVDIINNNREEFISYIHKLGLHVSHRSQTTSFQNNSTTILTLRTTCFKVDFNDNFVKISPLK